MRKDRRNRVRVAGRCHGGAGRGEGFEHAGWTFEINRGDDGDAFKLEETRSSEALLLGRVTYGGLCQPGRP
jgi:hypothetical protein